ncbi:MAG: hypothetical protein ACKPFK_23380, partial [Dolichospermum sp.]
MVNFPAFDGKTSQYFHRLKHAIAVLIKNLIIGSKMVMTNLCQRLWGFAQTLPKIAQGLPRVFFGLIALLISFNLWIAPAFGLQVSDIPELAEIKSLT